MAFVLWCSNELLLVYHIKKIWYETILLASFLAVQITKSFHYTKKGNLKKKIVLVKTPKWPVVSLWQLIFDHSKSVYIILQEEKKYPIVINKLKFATCRWLKGSSKRCAVFIIQQNMSYASPFPYCNYSLTLFTVHKETASPSLSPKIPHPTRKNSEKRVSFLCLYSWIPFKMHSI